MSMSSKAFSSEVGTGSRQENASREDLYAGEIRRGGKGVAVYIGVLIGLFWPAALIFCAMWLATAFTTRYSSLSALVAAFITPLFLWWFGHPALASLFVALTLLLFYMHRENIKRLQAGTEGRIGKS